MKINSDIGVTNEIAVLAAIAEGCGPALYRTSIGTCGWGPGQLDGEIRGESPWKLQNRWLNAPATIESIFNLNGEEQWQQGIEIVAQNKINSWL
jgi:putative transcriptional regulator